MNRFRRKLIEVSLPLEAINAESAREKSIRHGHPSTLHLWWARRPLAACRAVLWASLVDDPSSWPDRFPTPEAQQVERQRLFDILARFEPELDRKGQPKLDGNGSPKLRVAGLVSWDDINHADAATLGVLYGAQREIARCLAWERDEEPPTDPEAVRAYIAQYAPPAYDPFAGGGSIPLEAQRLGLEAHASDLNPVAVLINKALIEIPPRFRDRAPINGVDRYRGSMESWRGAQGLAADVRFYGAWMRDRAMESIGHLYPKVMIDDRGTEATAIAWLWARTVRCPNPACGCVMPLVRSFELSTKKGKEAWVVPVIDRTDGVRVRFEVRSRSDENREETAPEGTVGRKGAVCVACEEPVKLEYVRSEGRAGRMGQQLMAIVAEGQGGRVYVAPTAEHEAIALSAVPKWKPDTDLPKEALGFRVQNYGMTKHADLFTNRQLVALTTFSDLVSVAKDRAIASAIAAGLPDDDVPLAEGGAGARAYGEAIAVYLAFALSKVIDANSALVSWRNTVEATRNTFARQAIPMVWDFTEANLFSNSCGNWTDTGVIRIFDALSQLRFVGKVNIAQHDATQSQINDTTQKIISTDPPYYDAVPYADLSDFFYTWLRLTLKSINPDICNTVLTPKSQEMVADPFRHGSRKDANVFFEQGLTKVFTRANRLQTPDYPLTVYYALKQSEKDEDQVSSTGWETILEGLIKSKFCIAGTWPLRTEKTGRMRSIDSNALASSIVLVCRPRATDAPKATRRQFLTELRRDLPNALKTLQQANIAPVDLAQASIGPGMEIYSKYAAILEADGTPLPIRTALQLINQTLDEFQSEQEGELDTDTRWAIAWYEQFQFGPGDYGIAETLSKAKNTSIQGLVSAGILQAKAGKVQLLKRSELPDNWNPTTDDRIPDWEATQHLIHALDQHGEVGAAELLMKLRDRAENYRDLAYRLYMLCDRKGWTQDAIAYNSLILSWPEMNRLVSQYASSQDQGQSTQTALNLSP